MKKPADSTDPQTHTYVTRAEFIALVQTIGVVLAGAELAHRRAGYADGSVSVQLERVERAAGLPSTERAVLKQIIKAFDSALNGHFARERRRAADAAVDARAFNF